MEEQLVPVMVHQAPQCSSSNTVSQNFATAQALAKSTKSQTEPAIQFHTTLKSPAQDSSDDISKANNVTNSSENADHQVIPPAKSGLLSLSFLSGRNFCIGKSFGGRIPRIQRAYSTSRDKESNQSEEEEEAGSLAGHCSRSLDELTVGLKREGRQFIKKIAQKSISKQQISRSCEKLNGKSSDEDDDLDEVLLPGDMTQRQLHL